MRRGLRWLLVLCGFLVWLVGLGLGRLILAGQGRRGSAEQQRAHDTLHYWGHLILGRGLNLVPGLQSATSEQYQRAALHSRTGEEQDLLTIERPRRVWQLLPDLARVGWLGLLTLLTNPLVRPLLLPGLLAGVATTGIWMLVRNRDATSRAAGSR